MNALVLACVPLFVDEVVNIGRLTAQSQFSPNRGSLERASTEATELFAAAYDERMEEYSSVGSDWLRLILSKFGRHFSEAVTGGEISPQIYTDAQMEVVRMHAALVGVVPELFKP